MESKLTAADPSQDPVRDELRRVEEALAARRQELVELQADQPSDTVTITTMKEELEALIAALTARRDALVRQLGDASTLRE
jgi:septal ring factor EnvC (AmiA/AmiB activator)